jgi:poly-beta-1,6-N-acetyl-D-glucosamine biosynthesis protein PgaD
MSEFVIEAPEKQSLSQRISTILISACGWILWLYVSFPLLTICGHFLHLDFCSALIDRVGGAWSLAQLMQLYGYTLLFLSNIWAVWIIFRLKTRHRDQRTARPEAVTDADLCQSFQVESCTLALSRQSRKIDVAFDAQGQILALLPHNQDKEQLTPSRKVIQTRTLG